MNIDLGPMQRSIVEALKQDAARLEELDKERAAIRDRMAANRGKLDLIAELADKYGAEEYETDTHPGSNGVVDSAVA